jgi:DNA-binding beta-propeller fold protein YncE
MRASLLVAAAAAATSCASAATIFTLDPSWPVGIQGLNVSSITATAVTTNSKTGASEIHVAQRGTAEPFILVFDSAQGALLRKWGGNITSPHGMYAQGNVLYVTDVGDATVKVFDADDGLLVGMAGTPGKPGGGVDPPQFSVPADVAVTGAGYVLVSDGDGGTNNRVLELVPPASGSNWNVNYGVGGNGTGPGQFQSPHSIAYQAATKQFWVANRGDSRLDAFDAETGLYVGSWDGPSCFNGIPWGVRLDEKRGYMLVADGTNGFLYVLGIPPTMKGAHLRGSQRAFPACTMLQSINVGASRKPHELAIDAATGDVYLAGVGTPATIQRYVHA